MPNLTRQHDGVTMTAMAIEGGWVVSVDADPIYETMRFEDMDDAFEEACNWLDNGGGRT